MHKVKQLQSANKTLRWRGGAELLATGKVLAAAERPLANGDHEALYQKDTAYPIAE